MLMKLQFIYVTLLIQVISGGDLELRKADKCPHGCNEDKVCKEVKSVNKACDDLNTELERDIYNKFIEIQQIENSIREEFYMIAENLRRIITEEQTRNWQKIKELIAAFKLHNPINNNILSSCEDLLKFNKSSGIYKIQSQQHKLDFEVLCELHSVEKNDSMKAWTIIQRRQSGSVSFNRTWEEYEKGFGNFTGDFFLGLEKIHGMMALGSYQLWIQLETHDGQKAYALYHYFRIHGPSMKYTLEALGKYSGNAGNDLFYHLGMNFSTYDSLNNIDNGEQKCTSIYSGGWWYTNYDKCYTCTLNERWFEKGKHNSIFGIKWESWKGKNESLKYAHMAIRRVSIRYV